MRVVWVLLGITAVASYGYHKLRRGRPCRIAEVRPETDNVCTLVFEPEGRAKHPDYLPGQFHFVRLYRGDRYDGEEHHFTISSNPTGDGTLTSTVKASGDFTATIPETTTGDRAQLIGPFGRFSYTLHPHERDLVLIAGGIGITPLMAMLRHMRDTNADVDVCLLYGNRREKDIIFRDELAQIVEGERPRLRVVHVLSGAVDDWPGETGYIHVEMIRRHCGDDLAQKAFWVCGPPPMMQTLTKQLRRAGVPAARIHSERFAL